MSAFFSVAFGNDPLAVDGLNERKSPINRRFPMLGTMREDDQIPKMGISDFVKVSNDPPGHAGWDHEGNRQIVPYPSPLAPGKIGCAQILRNTWAASRLYTHL